MVLCPVCKKENNDEEYCTDCGTKLVNIIKDPIIKLDENEDISKVNELKIYFEEMNKKIIQCRLMTKWKWLSLSMTIASLSISSSYAQAVLPRILPCN